MGGVFLILAWFTPPENAPNSYFNSKSVFVNRGCKTALASTATIAAWLRLWCARQFLSQLLNSIILFVVYCNRKWMWVEKQFLFHILFLILVKKVPFWPSYGGRAITCYRLHGIPTVPPSPRLTSPHHLHPILRDALTFYHRLPKVDGPMHVTSQFGVLCTTFSHAGESWELLYIYEVLVGFQVYSYLQNDPLLKKMWFFAWVTW